MRKVLFAILLLSLSAGATTISASHVVDAFGNGLPAARLCFTPVNAANNPQGFRVGTNQIVPNEVCGKVTAGALVGGLSLQPNNTGTYYHIYVKPSNGNTILMDYGMSAITGTSWTLDTYDANLAVLPTTISTGTTTTLAPGAGASCTVTGSGPYLLNCGVPQGATGVGSASFAPWNSATTYALNSVTLYSGSLYQSLISSNLNHQPDTSPVQWQLVLINMSSSTGSITNITSSVTGGGAVAVNASATTGASNTAIRASSSTASGTGIGVDASASGASGIAVQAVGSGSNGFGVWANDTAAGGVGVLAQSSNATGVPLIASANGSSTMIFKGMTGGSGGTLKTSLDSSGNLSTSGTVTTNGGFVNNTAPGTAWSIDGAQANTLVTVANNGTYNLATGSGMVILHNSTTGTICLFLIAGGVSTVVSDPSAVYSGVSGTAGKTNLFYNGSTAYQIENKTGSSQSYYVVTIRSRTTN